MQPFSENCVKIIASVRLEFVHKNAAGQTDRQTDTHTHCNDNKISPQIRGGAIMHSIYRHEATYKAYTSNLVKINLY